MKCLLIIIICLSFTNAFSQTNKIACDTVLYHMSVIKNYVEEKNADVSLRRVESIAFLENLTQIDGSGSGTDIGKIEVKTEDYKKWEIWFEKNKKYLFYNTTTKKVELIKNK